VPFLSKKGKSAYMLVTKIWSMQPGKYFCLSTRAKGKLKGGLKDHWFERYQFHLVAKKIKQLRDRYNVWFCAHGFMTKSRTAEVDGKPNAEASHFLYADLDAAHPNSCPIKPTMATESSPGRFVGYWHVGEPIDWVDNQAWTKLIGADPGGWDPTQVLRAPTSFNHKYDPAPRVRCLWEDGADVKLSDIRARLPKVRKKDVVKVKGAAAVYKRWESVIPRIYRTALLSKVPTEKDRSAWMWRAGGVMLENGIPMNDVFTLLWNSGNNKYLNRKNGENLLRRELDKKLESKMAHDVESDGEEDYEMFAESMAEVQEEDVDWMWEPYVARGEVTIFEGDPGVGKSLLAQKLGVAVADGTPMPGDMRKGAKPQVVFFLDHENSKATVMKPRLSHNGLKNPQNIRQEDRSFSLDDEIAVKKIYEAIARYKAGLLVWDTLMNYAGNANTHNSAETSRIMGTFRDIAIKFNIPVVVLRHLTKDSKTKAAYRGQGSISFTGSARTVVGVGYAADCREERLFKVTKSNLTDCGSMPAQRMRLDVEGKRIKATFTGESYVTDEELLNTERMKAEDPTPVLEWLVDFLEDKTKTLARVVRDGESRGFLPRDIDIAIRKLTKPGKPKKGEPTLVLAA
jgi:archaellum biogenesis ATPase FlaH